MALQPTHSLLSRTTLPFSNPPRQTDDTTPIPNFAVNNHAVSSATGVPALCCVQTGTRVEQASPSQHTQPLPLSLSLIHKDTPISSQDTGSCRGLRGGRGGWWGLSLHTLVDTHRPMSDTPPTHPPTQEWGEDTLVKGIDPETQAEMLKLPKGYHWCVGCVWGCTATPTHTDTAAISTHQRWKERE